MATEIDVDKLWAEKKITCKDCFRYLKCVLGLVEIDHKLRTGELAPSTAGPRSKKTYSDKPPPHSNEKCPTPGHFCWPVPEWQDGRILYLVRQIITRRILQAWYQDSDLIPKTFPPLKDCYGKKPDMILAAALANSEMIMPAWQDAIVQVPHEGCNICCFRHIIQELRLRPYTTTLDANMLCGLNESVKHQKLSLREVYSVPGRITKGKYAVCAVPDTGAEQNIISAKATINYNLAVHNGERKMRFVLPNGREVWSEGTVTTPWFFEGEPALTMHVSFQVLRGCPSDLIFGNTFLKETKTMTLKNKRLRAQLVLEADIGCFFSFGRSQQRVAGAINGKEVTALPDTGCVLNLVTLRYAIEHDLPIDMKEDRTGALQYADGTIEETIGRLTTTWAFEDDLEHPIMLHFEVLVNCRYDIVLGQRALLASEAMTRHASSFFEQNATGAMELSPVVSRPHILKELEKLTTKDKDVKLADGIPLTKLTGGGISKKLWENMELVELQDRINKDRIIDAIKDDAERAQAHDKEVLRRKKWETFRDRVQTHMQPAALATAQELLDSASSAPQTDSEADTTVLLRESGSAVTPPQPVAQVGRRHKVWSKMTSPFK